MPSIQLTRKERDHLRSYFERELKDAHAYIRQLKSMLRKLDAIEAPTVSKPVVLKKEETQKTGQKPFRPIRAKTVVPEEAIPEVLSSDDAEGSASDTKPVAKTSPQKRRTSRRKKSNYRPQNVFLEKLSKPLPKLSSDDPGIPYGSIKRQNTQ